MASGDIGSKHWISLSIAGQGWQQTFITWSCIRPHVRPHIGHSILWGPSGGRGAGMHPDSPHSPSGIICMVSLHIDLLYGLHSRGVMRGSHPEEEGSVCCQPIFPKEAACRGVRYRCLSVMTWLDVPQMRVACMHAWCWKGLPERPTPLMRNMYSQCWKETHIYIYSAS